MSRNIENYRGARRNAWRAENKLKVSPFIPWGAYNSLAGYDIGTRTSSGHVSYKNTSKYMPHIGAKQRRKGLSV